jgi:hypothetical protein
MNVQSSASVDGTEITLNAEAPIWLGAPGGAPVGYERYLYDAYALPIRFPASDENLNEVDGTVTATLAAAADDMTGAQTDADPSTMLRWEAGGWTGYEDSDGEDLTDSGGAASITFQLSSEDQPPPFVVEPGTSSAWYDPTRSGEGFMLEILPEDRAVMYWFTYDDAGDQDWFIAVGEVRGNRVLFPAVLQVSGGGFGPDFDPNAVSETVVGSASFIWSGCDSGAMSWNIGDQAGRMDLQRLSTVMGVPCGDSIDPPLLEIATLSGSWYDPSHAGEGYTLEVLADQRLLVYWFGFDPDGNRRWFFGIGAINGAVFEFDDMLTTTGGVFGDAFDPANVEELPWGSLELELNCEGGEARFTPTEAGFPPGTLDLVQLTWLDTLQCSD